MEDTGNIKNQSQIAGAILIVGIMITGAILLRGGGASGQPANVIGSQKEPVEQQGSIKPVTKNDHILGNPNAKIMIVEFSDTECPYCKVFHNTMLEIVKNNPDVGWVYRHYPIAQLHQKAFHEAEATECAGELGGNDGFWKYLNEVMKRTGSNDKLDVAELPKIAKDVGLDVAQFNTCLESGKFADKINGQIAEAQQAGARGTPSSFIVVNGKVVDTIPGAQPLAGVQAKIDALK